MTTIIHNPYQQWLMRRRELITASDVGAVLGLDPFRAPADVYADKLGVGGVIETHPMTWGRRLEPAVADGYECETLRVAQPEPPYEIAIHPDIPWLGATLDRGVKTVPGLSIEAPAAGLGALELKATASAHQWDDEPPEAYQIQLTIQMACTRRNWGSLAAFVSLWKPVFWVDRVFDPELFGLMVPRLEAFHHAVKTRNPPSDPSWYSRGAIRALWPVDDGSSIAMDADTLALVDRWDAAREAEGAARRDKEAFEDALRVQLGAATLGYLPDGTSLTLKTVPATEIKAYTREAYRTLRRFRPKGKK